MGDRIIYFLLFTTFRIAVVLMKTNLVFFLNPFMINLFNKEKNPIDLHFCANVWGQKEVTYTPKGCIFILFFLSKIQQNQ